MFKIEFSTGNAAFHDDVESYDDYVMRYEVTRILKTIANKIENGYTKGSCIDINGNKIGTWKLDM